MTQSRPASFPADKSGSWLFSTAARLFGQSASCLAASLIYTAASPELDGGCLALALAGRTVGGASGHGLPPAASAGSLFAVPLIAQLLLYPPPAFVAYSAGRGGGYCGPPYMGPLSANILNCSPLTPLNPRAHSTDSCR